MDQNPIPNLWSEMVTSQEYRNWTIPQIDKVCAMLMELSAADREQLSNMGAVRIPREKSLNFIRSKAPTQNVWPILVNCKVNGQDNSLGYI
eukprot:9205457-Heterocapsa_arctica.AAC.1